jgi:hypothetical protein
MKKLTLSILVSSFLFTTLLFAQTGEKKGWTKEEKTEFITACIGTAKSNMSTDSARRYCICMQENVEAKYPVSADASKLTSEDLTSPEWKKLIQGCLSGHWSDEDRKAFMTSCVDVAKNTLGEGKAKSYCECMLYKVEKKYPNSADAAKLNEEELAKPAWQKAAKDCME